ncbi:hypothetical protein D3C79_766680 [compost metagenome]
MASPARNGGPSLVMRMDQNTPLSPLPPGRYQGICKSARESLVSTCLPSAVVRYWLKLACHEAPRQRSRWFHMASTPLPGIGNGMPPEAPSGMAPAGPSTNLPLVALAEVASYTDCGAAALRWVGYTSNR